MPGLHLAGHRHPQREPRGRRRLLQQQRLPRAAGRRSATSARATTPWAISGSTATATSAAGTCRPPLYAALGRDDHHPLARRSRRTSAPASPPPRSRATSTGCACASTRWSASGDKRSLRRQGDRLRRDPREPAVRRRRHELLDPPGGAARSAAAASRSPAATACCRACARRRTRGSRTSSTRACCCSASAPTSTCMPELRVIAQPLLPALPGHHGRSGVAAQPGAARPRDRLGRLRRRAVPARS